MKIAWLIGIVWVSISSFNSLAQEEQEQLEKEVITGKPFPAGFGVERSSISPNKRYGVLVPLDFDHYDDSRPQNELVEIESGRTLVLIKAETGKAGFMNHGGILASRWSTDSSLLLWQVAGKWAQRACVLVKIDNGKVKWQRDLLKLAREAILARLRKHLPKEDAAGAALNVEVSGKDDEPLSLPLAIHATFETQPKAVEPPPKDRLYSEMDATVDAQGKWTVKNFRTE
jgi:hypothetical protein